MLTSRRTVPLFLIALGWSLAASCGGGRVSQHTTLDGSVDSLRAAFQSDSGKVRAIFLASPT